MHTFSNVAMYWLRSRFAVDSKQDLAKLRNVYKDVAGEATLHPLDKPQTVLEWTKCMFDQVPDDFLGSIECRLVGPHTVFNKCIKIKERHGPEEYKHDRLDTLVKWANHMDKAVHYEMNRRHDLCVKYGPFDPPIQGDTDFADLLAAATLSKHVEYFLPLRDCVLVANSKSTYLSFLRYKSTDGETGIPALVYDIDDGFMSLCTGYESENLDCLNAIKDCS